ncbi:MAG: bifunctional 4-hydroxy-3-methylbut-2-enyl diphosphate reductase/30S ribosomal protein S1 [Ruminococcaceae bacterium]|nr:bifunctional 4-hydroxy-3-methylbut-2-enyl diphosphate reductase/30S ribosomal protein S1 [Oscillospiraceae bacterium]
MKTKITLAKTAGFCFGVDRAVKLVYNLIEKGEKVCTLGPIIHNPQLVKELEEKGVIIISEVSQAPKGYTVVIRSHGVGKEVYDYLEENNIPYVDATCPFVSKIHKIVNEESKKGGTILIAGNASHPEVEGIMGHCDGESFAFSSAEELENFINFSPDFCEKSPILVAQTTFQVSEWEKCKEKLKKVCTNPIIFDTICIATDKRQHEAEKLAAQSDIMIVIGGRESSNTNKLCAVCSQFCKTVHIESAKELDEKLFKDKDYIGVTAGASTPSYIIKEVQNTMSEILEKQQIEAEAVEAQVETAVNAEEGEFDFAKAIDDTFKKVHRGQRVKGIVVGINPSELQIDLGTKHAGFVPADEFTQNGTVALSDAVKVGDEVELEVTKVNDQEGYVLLSKQRIDSLKGYEEIVAAKENNTTVEGVVFEVVNGGVLANAKGTRVFIPASQTGVAKDDDLSKLLKQKVSFKILELTDKRGRRRVVGSIKAVLNAEKREMAAKVLESIEVGKTYTGTVKSLTSYGAFVDIGGVDGMIHITELSWKRIKNPSEVVSVGDSVEVYVKDFDAESKKISLGYKKTEDNPWEILKNTVNVDDVIKGKVVSLPAFGAFVTVIDGIDGLVHISQIANKRINKPSDVLKVGDEVEAKVVGIDYDAKRVSLSMRALIEETEAEEQAEIVEEYETAQAEAAAEEAAE